MSKVDHHAAADAVRSVMNTELRFTSTETPSLPMAAGALFTLDEVQLYDLTYHAVTRYLHNVTGMPRSKSHIHAGRIAASAVVTALASDYRHDREPAADHG